MAFIDTCITLSRDGPRKLRNCAATTSSTNRITCGKCRSNRYLSSPSTECQASGIERPVHERQPTDGQGRIRRVHEQALAIPNCNAFTKALLAKYSLTAGRLGAANRLADKLIDIPLSYEDAALPICELLAMLGRDEDLHKFVVDNKSLQEKSCDEFRKSGWLHYQAYANCRLGNISEAKRLWTASMKCASVYPEVKENLERLQKGHHNAPSATLITSWIPSFVTDAFRNAVKESERDTDSYSTICTTVVPQMFHLMPYLLDRGDRSDSDRMPSLQFLGQQSDLLYRCGEGEIALPCGISYSQVAYQ